MIQSFKSTSQSSKSDYWHKFNNVDQCLDDIDIDSDIENNNFLEDSDDDENMNDLSDRNVSEGMINDQNVHS